VTIQEQFESMTVAEHAALKSKVLEITSTGGTKPKADTLEGYALRKYFHMTGSLDLPDLHESVLTRLADDPCCYEQAECVKELERRRANATQRLIDKRQVLEADPFDPRHEVSADAKKIVAHLGIIFVLLPFVLARFSQSCIRS
jgi:hypothetical protein